MASLRTKLYMVLMLAALFICGQNVSAQDVGTIDDGKDQSVIINQGIDAAKNGIVYWNNELKVSGVYCIPETKTNCLNQEATCNYEIKKWSDELSTQLNLADKYVMHSATYWTAKKYLDWAYKTRDALKALYEATQIKELKMVLAALSRAIEAAEYLISKFIK